MCVRVCSEILVRISEANTRETEIRSKAEDDDHTHIHTHKLIHTRCDCEQCGTECKTK